MTAPFNQMEPLMRLAPVIPVITIEAPDQAVPLARALVRGGLPVLEITLRTAYALDAIEAIAAAVPEAVVGAGTVIHPRQVDQVARAGGRFCVSPGATQALLETMRDAQMQFLPGAVTASEVMNLLSWDIHYMKFFPAEAVGGVPALKSLAAPLPDAHFCPTGGIKPETALSYLNLPNVLCIGGTWVCPPDLLRSGQWDAVERLAAAASALRN